jgi:hypothetical protein
MKNRIKIVHLFIILVLLNVGCTSTKNIRNEIKLASDIQKQSPYIYVLEFDHNGKLTSPQEIARAIRELSVDKTVDAAIIMSLGWGHNRDNLVSDYNELLKKYSDWKKGAKKPNGKPKAIFAISWESSLTGFGHLLGDILPIPNEIANSISIPFQPLTYWSKARQADKIGFGDLKIAITEVIKNIDRTGTKPLNIYVLAHSFGSRIVTGMLNRSENPEMNLPEGQIKGGILILPALSSYELHSLGNKHENHDSVNKFGPSYPLLVVQSRHDHLNRLIFPLANIPLNSGYLRYSDIFRTSLLKNLGNNETVASLYDYALFPFMFPYSAMVFADSYITGQFNEINQRGWLLLPDTLTQLPFIEIPFESINKQIERDSSPEAWGAQHKGLFHVGAMHESATTYVNPHANRIFDLMTSALPLDSIGGKALVHPSQNHLNNRLPNGIIPIDLSEKINKGIFFEEPLNESVVDWTVGWLDPVGAHTDWEQPAVYQLIYDLIESNHEH